MQENRILCKNWKEIFQEKLTIFLDKMFVVYLEICSVGARRAEKLEVATSRLL